jgi:RNA polymerase sigma-70 factor, ECF subfamily
MTNRDDPRIERRLDSYRSYLLFLAKTQIGRSEQPRLDPSDIVQESLLEAHRDRSRFHGGTSAELAGWLRQILARNLADAAKAQRREKRNVARERHLADLETSSLQLAGILAVDTTTPSQQAVLHERAVRLASALDQLPELQRQALILQNWHGLRLAEIAVRLNRTTAAVAGLIKRGVRRLREVLAELPPVS